MRALLVESILRVMVAIDLLGSACVGGTYLGQVGRVGQGGVPTRTSRTGRTSRTAPAINHS